MQLEPVALTSPLRSAALRGKQARLAVVSPRVPAAPSLSLGPVLVFHGSVPTVRAIRTVGSSGSQRPTVDPALRDESTVATSAAEWTGLLGPDQPSTDDLR